MSNVFCFILWYWKFQNHQASPRSTPNSSPRSTKSPPIPSGPTTSSVQPCPRSAPQTPMGMPSTILSNSSNVQTERNSHLQHGQNVVQLIPLGNGNGCNSQMDKPERSLHNDSLTGVGGDVRNAFGGTTATNISNFHELHYYKILL